MSPKTIVHIIDSLGVGGAEILLRHTLPMLPGFRHVLITLGPPDDQKPFVEPHLSAFHCLHISGRKQWPKAILRIRSLIRQHKPVLVHAHLQQSGLLAKMACPARVPLFYTLHSPYGMDAFRHSHTALIAERITARSYHHLIGVSGHAIQDYKQYVPRCGTADVLYNFIDQQFFDQLHQPSYQPGRTLRCVSVGNLKEAKNYIFTLQAMKACKDLPISLDIYGGGADEAMLRAYVSEHGLSQVHFKGRVAGISALLPDYDLYLISSSYEGFGLAPFEAMACGLPVLASDIPVFREVLGDAALFFGLDHPQKLSALLQQAAAGQLHLAELSRKGRARASSLASPEAYRQKLLGIYGKYIPIDMPA